MRYVDIVDRTTNNRREGGSLASKYEDFTDLIMTSYRVIQKIKTTSMKKINLKAGDVNCIYYLSRYQDGLSNARLADLSGVDKAAISRTLNSLMDKGYVSLSAEDDPAKYGRRYVLTGMGRAAADEVNQKVESVVNEVGKNISIEDGTIFYATFHTISDQLVKLSEE